jgi:uncharacterized protein YuzE
MKTEKHSFVIKTKQPPQIEFDSAARAFYVRFKRSKIARTVSQNAERSHITIDLDDKGEVVGIEAIGVEKFSLEAVLKLARTTAPNINFARAQFAPTDDLVPA